MLFQEKYLLTILPQMYYFFSLTKIQLLCHLQKFQFISLLDLN